LKRSFELKLKLKNLTFFSADAVSMYTNIDTDHALEKISHFLRTSALAAGSNSEAIISGLEILMRPTYFSFGDTHWLQTTGTAMGTPPGCASATLYYGIWELELLSLSFPTAYLSIAATLTIALEFGYDIQTPQSTKQTGLPYKPQ
jgi:hypothetical protein